MPEKLKLSPTTGLKLFLECPRCFWLRYNEDVHRPKVPFPSLPGGMDRLLRKYFDEFRAQDKLPPEIEGQVEGKLFQDQDLLNEWRNPWKGLRYEDEKLDVTLGGALDECLIDGKYYIPVDYKTRSGEPKEGDSEKYYQNQLDCYTLLLSKNGYPTRDFAYLVYYYPTQISKDRLVKFECSVVKLATSTDRAYKVFSDAVNCLKGPIPPKHTECGYCAWYTDLLEYD